MEALQSGRGAFEERHGVRLLHGLQDEEECQDACWLCDLLREVAEGCKSKEGFHGQVGEAKRCQSEEVQRIPDQVFAEVQYGRRKDGDGSQIVQVEEDQQAESEDEVLRSGQDIHQVRRQDLLLQMVIEEEREDEVGSIRKTCLYYGFWAIILENRGVQYPTVLLIRTYKTARYCHDFWVIVLEKHGV